MMLERLGYRAVGAEGGRQAVDLLTSAPRGFSGALVDLVMPDMDGVSTRDALCRLAPRLPVLFITGRSPAPPLLGRLAPDGGALLAKPFSLGELARAVEGLFR